MTGGPGPGSSVTPVTVLFTTHPQFLAHDTGPGHPERPSRLEAVGAGITAAGLEEALVTFVPRPASAAEVARVHPDPFLHRLAEFIDAGGGNLDPDTVAVPASYAAALLAAGAGLESVARLDAGEGDVAFCAVRPPGHHATPTRSMGFCLLNNVAVTARALADRGERVLIVDYDAHHGNGTQDVFYGDGDVVYVSFHEFPLYPGTGGVPEMGEGDGFGATINFPLPSGATGDVYRTAIEQNAVRRVGDRHLFVEALHFFFLRGCCLPTLSFLGGLTPAFFFTVFFGTKTSSTGFFFSFLKEKASASASALKPSSSKLARICAGTGAETSKRPPSGWAMSMARACRCSLSAMAPLGLASVPPYLKSPTIGVPIEAR